MVLAITTINKGHSKQSIFKFAKHAIKRPENPKFPYLHQYSVSWPAIVLHIFVGFLEGNSGQYAESKA